MGKHRNGNDLLSPNMALIRSGDGQLVFCDTFMNCRRILGVQTSNQEQFKVAHHPPKTSSFHPTKERLRTPGKSTKSLSPFKTSPPDD
jgi:hypothetical protein